MPVAKPLSEIELLRQESLTSLVQREIERRIVAGELTPGAKLNEAELAAAMGVSRGPLREAFRALGQAGLVHTEKNRGVFVRQVSLAEANEICAVRAARERVIGGRAAKGASREQGERLRGIVKRMQAAGRKRDPDAYFPRNIQFHEVLAEAARNRSLAAHSRRVLT